MTLALTRASTVGPVAQAVEQAGGSVRRLLRAVDLPARTLERPDSLILLRDQFRLVEVAARLIGDDALPARLATDAGVQGLGPYGDHVMSFPDLGAGIARAYLDYGRLLQAATQMELHVRDGRAVWSYRVTAPLTTGRQKNELLAIGYMLSIIRSFAGASWTPDRVEVPGTLQGRAAVEDVFRAAIAPGARAAVVFPAAMLDCPAPATAGTKQAAPEAPVPAADDVRGVARIMIGIERDLGRFGIAAVAARLGMTQRSLQRLMSRSGTSYTALRAEHHRDAAMELLGAGGLSVTETAARLGYADVAHFTRAFRRWTGTAPSRWRDRRG